MPLTSTPAWSGPAIHRWILGIGGATSRSDSATTSAPWWPRTTTCCCVSRTAAGGCSARLSRSTNRGNFQRLTVAHAEIHRESVRPGGDAVRAAPDPDEQHQLGVSATIAPVTTAPTRIMFGIERGSRRRSADMKNLLNGAMKVAGKSERQRQRRIGASGLDRVYRLSRDPECGPECGLGQVRDFSEFPHVTLHGDKLPLHRRRMSRELSSRHTLP